MNNTGPKTETIGLTETVPASTAAPTPTLAKKIAAALSAAETLAVKPARAAPAAAAAAAPDEANRRLVGSRPAVKAVSTRTAKIAVKTIPTTARKKPAASVAARAMAPVADPRSAKPAPKALVAKTALAKARPAKLPARAKTSPAPQLLAALAPVSQAAAKVAPAAAAKPVRSTKDKLVRDSFTMPRADFALIQQLKERALVFKRATKKSELLRAGLQALAGLSTAQLQAQLGKLATIKAGRPKKAV